MPHQEYLSCHFVSYLHILSEFSRAFSPYAPIVLNLRFQARSWKDGTHNSGVARKGNGAHGVVVIVSSV
ncbi:predicted protein [Botrytis cinerea T4]|uniref:Uncharacterized protein n=1 Tax=Botryotinia fuckeliana (strain T4) TaxID=999810 RepID=G2Y6G4_BOTF4|nr:predicted protein [Botrytis cinerea T4]